MDIDNQGYLERQIDDAARKLAEKFRAPNINRGSEEELQPLDPERAKELATLLAKEQDEIIQLMQDLPEERLVGGVRVDGEEDVVLHRTEKDGIEIINNKQAIRGIGSGHVWFGRDSTLRNRYNEFRKATGVNTPDHLLIFLQTDELHMKEATDRYNYSLKIGKRPPVFETYYFFGLDGTYGKVVRIDPFFVKKDDRKRIPKPAHVGNTHVVDQMTARDFELASQALSSIKACLLPPKS